MRLFVRGDLDGFFGLALDNLIQLLLINTLCRFVLGFDDAIVLGRILPGVAVSLLVGNVFYAWQARHLARRTGRTDVCALPYGINTVSLYAHVLFVMAPARQLAMDAGMSPADASEVAWKAGLAATIAGGLIEFFGAFVAGFLRRFTPRAALLATLSGIALGFISLGFLFRTFAHPVVGLTTFGIVLMIYFGGVRFRGGIPGGLVAVAAGTALAWGTGLSQQLNASVPTPSLTPGFYPPTFFGRELLEAIGGPFVLTYLSVIVPMGLFNLIGSLQNIESAEAAGDPYPVAPSLAVNGLGSIAAALFGSTFPTTIYIGHPGWKALGARAGYSTLNALFFTAVCLTGWLAPIAYAVPVDAGMAIVLWIGIVITAQAFQATPREHAPAAVIGILPGVAAWGLLMAQTALRVGGVKFESDGAPGKLLAQFEQSDIWLTGAFALEKGFIFTSMILAAMTVALIEKRFLTAAAWCFGAAALAASGIIHGFAWTGPATVETVLRLHWNEWATGYSVMGSVFLLAPLLTEPGESH